MEGGQGGGGGGGELGFHPNSTFLAELGKGKFPLVQVKLD